MSRIWFECNVCGRHASAERADLGRENVSCGCRSSVRMRSVIHLLSMHLFGESLAIRDFPYRPSIKGIGLSDWPVYGDRLAGRLGYTNTYYHQAPRVDITDVPAELRARLDFIISTDVFEHVLAPVSAAFRGARDLLAPGGAMIFSVPFLVHGEDTIEHFEGLHEFQVEEQDGRHRLVNRRADGRIDMYDELIFHGGPGETLEMRVFTRHSLLREFDDAGFDVEVFDHDVPERGIVWHQTNSVPMLARKRPG
jgi:hypothetical protein